MPFHKNFKLQGKSFSSKEELINFSKKNLDVEVANFLQQWFDDSLFLEVKTSGSTGKPKVIKLQKNYMVNSAIATGNYFNLFENSTALLCMSSKYIAGKMMLVRALTLGWHIDIVEASLNPLKNCEKQYDFSAMVPMQLHNSLTELHKLKKLIVGGGVVSDTLLDKIQNVNTEIFATYGMTETITHIAVKKLNNCHSKLVEKSYYKTLPNITILTDSRGCLIINAPDIAKEKVITNDLVELVSPIAFKWLGRFDTVINSGGVKLIPNQIEKKISKVITERFFVAGIKDEVLGEKLILVIEKLLTERSRTKKRILNSLKNLQSLTKYEIPKEIYIIKNFVETETKKINRIETLKMIKNID